MDRQDHLRLRPPWLHLARLVWLVIILASVGMFIIALLQSVFSLISNQQSEISVVLSTLAIAALANPLRGRIQNFIDRRFYRQKYDAEKALAEFTAAARSETDLERLTARMVEVVQDTLQPHSASVWMQATHKKEVGR